MLKIILLCLVAFFSVYLLGGELMPLRQYDKLEQRVTVIPDHYLFEVVGELLALGFFDDNDKVFFIIFIIICPQRSNITLPIFFLEAKMMNGSIIL